MQSSHSEKQQPRVSQNNSLLIDYKTLRMGKRRRLLFRPFERFLGIDRINTIYNELAPSLQPVDFCRKSLEALGIDYTVTEQEMAQIPCEGPLVVVANHPFGGLEGVILSELLLHVRPDLRILGNYLLAHIPQLRPALISVDPFNPEKSASQNAAALKKAFRWLSQGGALLTFPAGEVSSVQRSSGRITDPTWSPHVIRLITKTGARALPVYVHGRNSLLFNFLGLMHPKLRTALLPREMVNKHSETIALAVGSPINARRFAGFDNDREAVAFLRFNTYLLQHRIHQKGRKKRPVGFVFPGKPCRQAIIAPVPKRFLAKEISGLRPHNLLVSQKSFQVFWTTADQAPYIMREIARLRETSFRQVGEGTGRSMDLDRFDSHYLHLFLWNQETEEIVGAYRMGQTDNIIKRLGPTGLYTTTLFEFKPGFFKLLGDSLELGRSFIRTEYQKKFGCLAFLWQGIGAYIARWAPHYRYLFGPVSISQSYHTLSKNLMVEFLRNTSMDKTLSSLVRPKCAIRFAGRTTAKSNVLAFPQQAGIEDVSMMVSEIEDDHKGVPTLVKHYLKLNGKFLGFNLDKDFGHVIDGLVLVDLLRTEPKIIQRFMGADGMRAFFDHQRAHGKQSA